MTALADLPRWTAGLRRRVLPNGLVLLAQQDRSAPAVAVVSHVRAGFFDEPDRWVGISHVLEHMYFKGTTSRGPGAIARETKALGGYVNAHTSYDHTAYFAVLPPAGLAAALDIQSDALRNSVIDADELARELQVIIEEAKRKLDSPSAVAAETLHAVMFDRHRIRRWRIGTAEQLATYTRDDVLGYYRSRYVPSRVIVAIVGDVDPDAALDEAALRYGDWSPAEGGADPSPAEPSHAGVRTRTLRGDVAQPELVLGWRGVPARHEDAIPLELAAALFAAGRGSWLYQSLREPGLATGVGASHYAPTELGVFSIGADLAAERIPAALEAIGRALHRLADDGPSEADLDRARALLQLRWARKLERTEGRAMALAMAESLGDVELIEQEYARLADAGADEVRGAAQRHLDTDTFGAVAYLPETAGQDLSADAVREAFRRNGRPALPRAMAAWTPPRRLSSGAASPVRAHGVTHLALDGVDVLVRRKSSVPLVSVGVYYPRVRFDRPEDAGLATLTVRSAVRGAGPLGTAELAFAFEALGGTVAAAVAADWFGFATSVLPEHAPRAAELLRLVLEEPAFEAEAVEKERALLTEEVRQATDDMFRYPFEMALGAAFGDRGYGIPPLGTEATLARFTAQDTRRWLEAARLAARPAVIAVGDAEESRLADTLATVMSGLPAASARVRLAASPMQLSPEHRIRERDRAQTAIAMIFPGPARRDASRHAADVWAAIASGLGGRLFEALRDRKSLAYTVLLTSWQRSRAGAMGTYIATSPGREEEARAAMLAELGRFRHESVGADELNRAIRYLDGQAQVQRQSTSAMAAEMLDAWLVGDGLEELDDPGARFRSVTAEAVRAVAQTTLASGVRAEGVVRGK